jgi:hypothetical protein
LLSEIYNNLIFNIKFNVEIDKIDLSFEEFIFRIKNKKFLISKIEFFKGFYFLKNKKANISIRKKRYLFSDAKFKRAIKISTILAKIPFVRMISLCNSLPYQNSKKNADIDFFIITSKKRIWLVRLIAVSFLKIFGLRPRKNKIKNTICLSFFTTDNDLNLQNLMINDQDIYFIYWIIRLAVVYDEKDTYAKFKSANKWVFNYLPFSHFFTVNNTKTINYKKLFFKNIIENTLKGGLGNFIENFSCSVQLKLMNNEIKQKANSSTEVVITDNVLKFHTKDRRSLILKQFLYKFINLLKTKSKDESYFE